MDLGQQFQVLGRQQLAIDEGIQLLRQARLDLVHARTSATNWGNAAVIANVIMVPLNCIVNAFELKTAASAYEVLVRAAYNAYGASGTRSSGPVKKALSSLKQAIVWELKRKSLAQFVPGANIVVGLAEDSLAMWQVIADVSAGSKETEILLSRLDSRIDLSVRELGRLGALRADVLGKIQTTARTA